MSNYSKRRMVCVMPIEAVIGKMAPKNQRVNRENAGFKCFVGYQKGSSVYNRYQVKSRPRSTDVTAGELQHRQKFATVLKATRARMQDPVQAAQDQLSFAAQTKYKTLYSYVFNQEWKKA